MAFMPSRNVDVERKKETNTETEAEAEYEDLDEDTAQELAELKTRMDNETGANGPEPVEPAPGNDTDQSANG